MTGPHFGIHPERPRNRWLVWGVVTVLALVVVQALGLAIWLVHAGGGDVHLGLWRVRRVYAAPAPTSYPTPTGVVRPPVAVAPRPTTPTPTPRPTPTPTPPPPSPTPTPPPVPTPPPRIVTVARSHGIDTGGRYIVVDQAEQRMYVVNGLRLVRVLPISSGDPKHGWFTPAWVGRVGVYWGTFSARGVYADDAWHLFKTPSGNILIHGVPYTRDASGRKVYQGLDQLGETPASRGCIRLRPEDARWFTEWQPAGVPIVILPHPQARR